MQKIGILTSGGDAPGMNACIRAIVRSAAWYNLEVIGIRRGYTGLFTREFVRLGPRSVSNILQLGGTVLGTSRCAEMKTVEGRQRAIQTLQDEGIWGLIVLGGDGTFRGASTLVREGQVKVMGIPTTIDNDVYGTDYSVGFDTAINTALESIDRIRDTALSHDRIFFVEVMGKTRGFIALEVGIAGGAEAILIPEVETDIEKLCIELERSHSKGKKSIIVIVAEGDAPGGAMEIARQVGERLGLEYRVCILGHVQRGGPPTARSRVLACKLSAAAVYGLLHGKEAHMVGEVKGEIVYTPLEETFQRTKELDKRLLEWVKVLAT